MKVGNVYVDYIQDCDDNKDGYYCTVYIDADCEFEIDNFCIHTDDCNCFDEQAVEDYIKEYVKNYDVFSNSISLKELFDNGIQYLHYGGYISLLEEDGYSYYELYANENPKEDLLLYDGDRVTVFKEYNKYFCVTEYKKSFYLTKEEFEIASYN